MAVVLTENPAMTIVPAAQREFTAVTYCGEGDFIDTADDEEVVLTTTLTSFTLLDITMTDREIRRPSGSEKTQCRHLPW